MAEGVMVAVLISSRTRQTSVLSPSVSWVVNSGVWFWLNPPKVAAPFFLILASAPVACCHHLPQNPPQRRPLLWKVLEGFPTSSVLCLCVGCSALTLGVIPSFPCLSGQW